MRKLIVAFCLLSVTGALAQTEPRAQSAIAVTLVEVPVHVYDRGGNAVRGLTAADFELTDDGVKREITNFEEINLASVTGKALLSPVARRNFMLLFDLSYSSPGTIGRARQAALDFIKNELTPADMGAVATYKAEGGFKLLTNFTSDREALIAAVTTLGHPQFFHHSDPLLLAVESTGERTQVALTSPATSSRLPDNGDELSGSGLVQELYTETMLERNEHNERQDVEFRRSRVSRQLAALASIGRVLDNVAGRKQIILLSEGFDASLIQGRESVGTAKETQLEAERILNANFPIDMETRYGNMSAAAALSDMGALLRRSDVVLHAIDIKGLRSDVDASAGLKHSSSEGLYLLTRATGGEVFKNNNDLNASFRALLKQQEVVYVLGFQAPAGTKSGTFHTLDVKLRKPGVKVSHRSGYYEPDGRISGVELALTAGQILLNDLPYDAIRMNVVAAPFPVKDKNPQVPVVIEIDGGSLLQGVREQSDAAGVAKWQGINGELFVYAFDRNNKAKDFLYQRFELDAAKVGETLQKSGLRYYGTLSLPPGDYAIKTLVRIPQATLDGFKRVDVTVPDFSKPAVTPPVAMGQAGGWLMVRGTKPDQSYEYPFAVASESFVPGIASGTPQRLALFLYHVDPKDVALNVTLKTPDGTSRPAHVSIVGVTAPDAAESSQMVLELKTDGLAAGKYALDLAVQTKAAGWSKAFSIPVSVQ